MTIYPPRLHEDLAGHYIFLDTNAFICAAKNQSFADFLKSLKKDSGCSFTTIPSVIFEFTNNANTVEKYNQRVSVVENIIDNTSPVNFLNQISNFYIVMSKANGKNKSYTDFLLAACLFNYRHTKTVLLTSDLRAFPSFFPRTHIVSTEHERDIINFGVYGFDGPGYSAAAKSLSNAAV